MKKTGEQSPAFSILRSVQAVEEVFGSFDSFFADAELPCDSLGCFFGFPQSAILTLCGELTGRIVVSASLPALGQLSSLLCFRNQNISLQVSDITPSDLAGVLGDLPDKRDLHVQIRCLPRQCHAVQVAFCRIICYSVVEKSQANRKRGQGHDNGSWKTFSKSNIAPELAP